MVTENITYLLARHPDLQFIIAVPFTFNKARDLARKVLDIEQDKNIVIAHSQLLYAEKRRDMFDDKYPIYYYHYCDTTIRATKKM
jgi:two-component SAPR family response regulator